jgi:hypothetical protein
MLRTIVAALTVCLSLCQNANAEIVLNGSFEEPGFSFSGSSDNFRYLLDSGDTSIANWTTTRTQSVGERVFWFHSSRLPTFEGSYALALTDGGAASTEIDLESNQSYLLSFYSYRDLNQAATDFALTVRIGSNTSTLFPGDATDTGVSAVSGQNWVKYEVAFESASSGLQQLQLTNNADGIASFDGGIVIDAVSVVAVPEPSAFAFMIAACIPAGFSRLRGRTKPCT